MLELRDLNVHYDMIHAIKGISLTVEKGEIVTLIGANGAGKTTTLRTIAGLKKPSSGSVWLSGKDITAATPRQRVQMGAAIAARLHGVAAFVYHRAGKRRLLRGILSLRAGDDRLQQRAQLRGKIRHGMPPFCRGEGGGDGETLLSSVKKVIKNQRVT